MKKFLLFMGIAVAVFGLIQIIPYGHDHSLPPVNDEPQWPSQQVHDIARRACFDCHSNETHWPWYSNIAPVSWLVYHDVTKGREHINFSDWDRPAHQHIDEVPEVLENHSMPPAAYLLLHPSARLSTEDRQILLDGLTQLPESSGH